MQAVPQVIALFQANRQSFDYDSDTTCNDFHSAYIEDSLEVSFAAVSISGKSDFLNHCILITFDYKQQIPPLCLKCTIILYRINRYVNTFSMMIRNSDNSLDPELLRPAWKCAPGERHKKGFRLRFYCKGNKASYTITKGRDKSQPFAAYIL